MSSDVAVCAEGLGKRYQIAGLGEADTLRDTIVQRVRTWRTPIGSSSRRRTGRQHIWALKDVSFDAARGRVLGVIGRNGAGKSTLLKILSRITEPSEGRARVYGRVASLLEIGVGFHPELTGRDNVFLNGAILGMSRRDILRRFDEIVDFAGVETFLDTPVKHYSSGMHVRLAFAVAAHVEPEILIVDEVLAVGDAGFQNKCLGKMEAVGRSGRTVLFVSHNLAAVRALCHDAIMIDEGRIVREGRPGDVINAYVDSFGETDGALIEHRADRYGDGRLRVTAALLADSHGRPVPSLTSGEPGQIVLRYKTNASQPLKDVLVNLYLYTTWGERLCDFQTDFVGDNFNQIPHAGEFVCSIPRVTLQPGTYSFSFRVYSSDRLMLDEVQRAGHIKVEPGDFFGSGRLPEPGAVLVDHAWHCRGLVAELVRS